MAHNATTRQQKELAKCLFEALGSNRWDKWGTYQQICYDYQKNNGGHPIQGTIASWYQCVDVSSHLKSVMGPEQNFLSLSGKLSEYSGMRRELFLNTNIQNGTGTENPFSTFFPFQKSGDLPISPIL